MLSYELFRNVVKASNANLRAIRLTPNTDEYEEKSKIALAEKKKYASVFADRNGAFDVDTEVVLEE